MPKDCRQAFTRDFIQQSLREVTGSVNILFLSTPQDPGRWLESPFHAFRAGYCSITTIRLGCLVQLKATFDMASIPFSHFA